MISSALDNILVTRPIRAETMAQWPAGTSILQTAAGSIRVCDTGGDRSPLVVIPDGPCVIEHYREVIAALRERARVICMEMPASVGVHGHGEITIRDGFISRIASTEIRSFRHTTTCAPSSPMYCTRL